VASTSGRAMYGNASATTGATYGVLGYVASTGGTGVYGTAGAATGSTIGVRGLTNSSTGTAGVFDAPGGGKILSGRSGAGYTERFSVDASGNVAAGGTMTGTRLVSTIASGTAPLQVASTTLVPNLYVSRASLADTATTAVSATSAATASTAATATNAESLGDQPASNYARLDVGNSFVGDQGITGKLTATGSTSEFNTGIVRATQNGSGDTNGGPGDLPPAAIRGDTTGNAVGVLGTAQENDGAGVAGYNTAGMGVVGFGAGPASLAGVVGWCEQATVGCIGVGSFLRMQGVLFEGRVAVDPTDDEGIVKFSVDASGNLAAAGAVAGTGGTFSGSSEGAIVQVMQDGTGAGLNVKGGTYGIFGSGTAMAVSGTNSVTGSVGQLAVEDVGVHGLGSDAGVMGTGGNTGVRGISTAVGVEGINSGNSSYGSLGTTVSGEATGVYGSGFRGVSGQGGWVGVFGSAETGAGVAGDSPSGTGVTGNGAVAGVHGDTWTGAAGEFNVSGADPNAKILSGRDNTVEKFGVDRNGNVWAAGNVGVGTSTPGRELEVNGGVRLNTATAKPTCDASTRGTFWVTLGGSGVEDLVEVCTKDAADAYGWRTVI